MDEDYLSLENTSSTHHHHRHHASSSSTNKVDKSQDEGGYSSMEEDTSIDGSNEDSSRSTSEDGQAYDNNGNLLPPWMDQPVDRRRINPITSFHNEMVGFARLMEATSDEVQQRNTLVDQIRVIVTKEFGSNAQVVVFGSQATGLFLPSSDIDLVILTEDWAEETTEKDNQQTESQQPARNDDHNEGLEEISKGGSLLKRFATALREAWYSELSYLEVLENTRVPLVKFTHASTNISVDVSFNAASGPPAAQLMKSYLNALPALQPLTLVIKYFLAARSLNQPYSGGVGSYVLQLLIVAFLQQREREAVAQRRRSNLNLGSLLLEFFELYGLEFNYYTTGVSVRHDGFFFPKGARKEVFYTPDRPYLLALENPLDTTMDVGKSSFRIQLVQRSFKVAHQMLVAQLTEPAVHSTPSVLASILPPTEEMIQRRRLKNKQKQKLQQQQDVPSRIDQPLSAKRSLSTASSQRGRNDDDDLGRKRQRRR